LLSLIPNGCGGDVGLCLAADDDAMKLLRH
jgi:hypothetical protein